MKRRKNNRGAASPGGPRRSTKPEMNRSANYTEVVQLPAPEWSQQVAPNQSRSRKSMISYVLLGIAISVVLVAAKVAFEHTSFGSMVERRTYSVLSNVLPQYRPDGPEVVVVDIGSLPGGTEDSPSGALTPTPRAELRAILDTLVQLRPRSIGVDVDFSPTPQGWVDDDDPEFFKHCLKLNEATPITLGVFRTLREPKSAWLGLPEFARLAGGMWLPPSGLERTPAWTQAPGVLDKLPSLGAKVAAAGGGEVMPQIEESGWLHRFRERTELTNLRPDGLRVGEVLTNHSPVAQLKREAIRIAKASDLWAYRGAIEGRIVLVGVNANAMDRFPVPTQDMNLPGVIVHASNAYTLAAEPIWEFSPEARYIIDFALSGVLLGIALWLTRGHFSSSRGDTERSERRALLWLIFVTLGACGLAVYLFRVLWLDFVLVAISLWLHPRVAALLHRYRSGVRTRGIAAMHS